MKISSKISETQQENIQQLSETLTGIREQSEVTFKDKQNLAESIADYFQGEGTLTDITTYLQEILDNANITEADIQEIKSDFEAIKTEFIANNPNFPVEELPLDFGKLPINKEQFISKLQDFVSERDLLSGDKLPGKFPFRKAFHLRDSLPDFKGVTEEGLPESLFADKISDTQQENIQQLSETLTEIREQSEVTFRDKQNLAESIADYFQGEGTLRDIKASVQEILDNANITEADIQEIKSDFEAIKTEFIANNPNFPVEELPLDFGKLPINKEQFISKLQDFVSERDLLSGDKLPGQFPFQRSVDLGERFPNFKGVRKNNLPEIDELTKGGVLGKVLDNKTALTSRFDGPFLPNFGEVISEDRLMNDMLERPDFSGIGTSPNNFKDVMGEFDEIFANLAPDMSTSLG